MARSATLWRITSHIEEFTFLLTPWAFIWWRGCCDEESALAAFPKSKTAFGTDISGKFTISDITAVGTLKFCLFILHSLHLNSLYSLFGIAK